MSEEKIKSLFMAQYLGQKIFTHPEYIEGPVTIDTMRLAWVAKETAHFDDGYYLLLRDVSQLEDFELELIARICGFEEEEGFYLAGEGKDIIDSVYGDGGNLNYPASDYVKIDAYLKSIGVVTGFTYLSENKTPVTLQPDELIAKGWVKLYS